MSKLFEHVSRYHHTTETLTMRECSQGLYVGINCVRELPYDERDEQTTSIVVQLSEIPELIQSLSKFASRWIDYEIKQPTEKGDYLIRDYQGRVALGKYGNGFYMESGGEKWGMVSHWMPIPELLEKELNHAK